MKNVLIFVLTLLVSISEAITAPYMFPDLGTPGMATYVEMIAEHNNVDFFWDQPDAFFPNNDGDALRVMLKNPNPDVVIGPLTVSWDGRLISTTVFVSPDYDLTGISKDWATTSGRIDLLVERNGALVAEFPFYIVLPTSTWGNMAGKNTIGGGNSGQNIGKMSPRNTIIVDSLDLAANVTYRISNQDPAPAEPGNQAYLPAVILSVGPIRGGVGTVIDVSANGIDGGPGGGGGGGKVCDGLFSAPANGDNGGDGFTGGGAGGRNITLNSSNNSFRDGGQGAGSSNLNQNGGSSINGVAGGVTIAYENGGGGTGHPFGQSGSGWTNGFLPEGGYGAGSGNSQTGDGGHGSYRTDGLQVNGQLTGKQHGTNRLIPLAGGSGGASGNPQAAADCSGNGGGGGGAIRIYAPYMSNLSIEANGGNGGADIADGGAGSGGGIELNGKAQIGAFAQVSAEAKGGDANNNKAGGDGFIKVNYDNGIVSGNAISVFSSSDTTRFVPRDFSLEGYRNPTGNIEHYGYIGGQWQKIGERIGPSNNYDWELNSQFGVGEDLLYISSVWYSRTNGTLPTQYKFDPEYVLSQSAWNILILDEVPDIDDKADTTFKLISCQGTTLIDSIRVENLGDADLILDMNASSIDPIADFADFTIISPVGDYIIPAKESGWIVFQFDNPDNAETTKRFRLNIISNDPDENPKKFIVNVERKNVDISFLDGDRNEIPNDTLDLGEVCLGTIIPGEFYAKNNSFQTLTISDYAGNPKVNVIPENNQQTILADSDLKYSYEINANQSGQWYSWVTLTEIDCPDNEFRLVFAYVVVDNELTFTDPTQLDFGPQLVNVGGERRITVENTGNGTVQLLQDPQTGSPIYQFLRYEPAITELKPSETVDLVFMFTPQIEGPAPVVNFTWIPDDGTNPGGCYAELGLTLSGTGSDYSVGKSPNVDLGLMYHCDTRNVTIQLWNYSSDVFDLLNQGTMQDVAWAVLQDPSGFFNYSDDVAYFSRPGEPQVTTSDNTLQEGDTVNFDVTFDPDASANGIYSSTLQIYTSADPSTPVEVIISAEVDSLQFTEIESDGVNDRVINFGKIPLNTTSAVETVDITLLSELQRRIAFVEDPVNTSLSEVDISFGQGTTLTPAQSSTQLELSIQADEYTGAPESLLYDLLVTPNCGETFRYELQFEVIQADIQASDIDLGIINPCYNQNLTILLENFGEVRGFIDSIVDKNGSWRWFSAFMMNPVEPESNTQLNLGFTINANLLGIGPFSEQLTVYTLENGVVDSIEIEVKGVVSAGFAPTEIVLDFGNEIINNTSASVIGSFQSEPALTVNTGNVVLPIKYPGVFSSDILALANMLLTGATDYEITGLFTPNALGEFVDTAYIEITISDPDCPVLLPVIFKGVGAPGASVVISIPDLGTVDPLQDELRVPIYAQIVEGIDTIELDVIDGLEISWNKTLFYPESVEGGDMRILSQDWQADREITVSLSGTDKTITTTEEEIFTIVGSPMLGNRISTELLVDVQNFAYSPQGIISSINGSNGVLAIEVCQDDKGNRLLDYRDPINITVSQTAGMLQLNAVAPYRGDYRVEVIDLTGRLLYSEIWTSNGEEVLRRNITLEAGASGVVYIRYSNNANVIVKQVTLIK